MQAPVGMLHGVPPAGGAGGGLGFGLVDVVFGVVLVGVVVFGVAGGAGGGAGGVVVVGSVVVDVLEELDDSVFGVFC